MKSNEHREELRKAYQHQEISGEAIFIPAKDKADIFSDVYLLRVCAYCRVSTDSDEQLSSFELQQEHYQQLVGHHPNWNLKRIYADEGISGTSLKNRDAFNEMIAECKAGKYDLIITKSVSRFARNLVDCVSLVRQLKSQKPPIGVYFETDGLNTLSEDSELKLAILSTFAQEESVKKSESMVWSLKERFKNKKLLTPELFGYRRPRDVVGNYIKYAKLQIVESEAAVVRLIFDAFLAGYSTSSIAELLTASGIETKIGNTVWNESAVSYILRNERYCGCVLTWKTFTNDIFEHTKRKNNHDRDQYFYTDTHDAIISIEKFEAVQTLLENKKYGLRGRYPTMQVINSGVFRGYVPVNHHWINEDPLPYYNASNSVESAGQTKRVRRNYFSAFNLTGYQVVRGQFMDFRMQKPCLTITGQKITFNSWCVRCFAIVSDIQLLLHPTERKIAIRPCDKKDTYNIPWRKNIVSPISCKSLSCQYFASALFQIMDWNPEYSYRIMGNLIKRGADEIIIFNLENAMPVVIIDDINKNNKQVKKKVSMCPEEWDNSFGEEFYAYCIGSLYYLPTGTDWRASVKCKDVDGQQPFEIMSEGEIISGFETLRLKGAACSG